MVDPNRKINRLTDKDIEFLDECEDEFMSRYTEEDEEFMRHCSKPIPDPPIVDNWSYGGGQQNSRMGGGYSQNYSNYRGGQRSNRGWHDRRNNRNNYKRDRYNPYENRRERRDDREIPNHPPMNVRRDYGNFVPASKD